MLSRRVVKNALAPLLTHPAISHYKFILNFSDMLCVKRKQQFDFACLIVEDVVVSRGFIVGFH